MQAFPVCGLSYTIQFKNVLYLTNIPDIAEHKIEAATSVPHSTTSGLAHQQHSANVTLVHNFHIQPHWEFCEKQLLTQ